MYNYIDYCRCSLTFEKKSLTSNIGVRKFEWVNKIWTVIKKKKNLELKHFLAWKTANTSMLENNRF